MHTRLRVQRAPGIQWGERFNDSDALRREIVKSYLA
jgi:hypothetical protein